MSDESISGQIAALRGEAAEARRLAATLTDKQAATDLILYAEALEAELSRLMGSFEEGEPGEGETPTAPAHASFLACQPFVNA